MRTYHGYTYSISYTGRILNRWLRLFYYRIDVFQIFDRRVVEIVVPQPMIWVILPLVLLADRIFPYLVPFLFSVLQPSLDFSGQPSALQAVPVIISGKILVCVFARNKANRAFRNKQYSAVFHSGRSGSDIHCPAKRLTPKSTKRNVLHSKQSNSKNHRKPKRYIRIPCVLLSGLCN